MISLSLFLRSTLISVYIFRLGQMLFNRIFFLIPQRGTFLFFVFVRYFLLCCSLVSVLFPLFMELTGVFFMTQYKMNFYKASIGAWGEDVSSFNRV